MYPYMNEDAAWQRLQDLQREVENSRLMGDGARVLLKRFGVRAWHLAGLAMQRPPRRKPRPNAASTTLAAWRLRSPNR